MKAFYSDTFVLPLPEHHRFPMAKYRLLRERIIAEGVVDPSDLHVPEPIDRDDLLLVHDAAYVDSSGPRSVSPLKRVFRWLVVASASAWRSTYVTPPATPSRWWAI